MKFRSIFNKFTSNVPNITKNRVVPVLLKETIPLSSVMEGIEITSSALVKEGYQMTTIEPSGEIITKNPVLLAKIYPFNGN